MNKVEGGFRRRFDQVESPGIIGNSHRADLDESTVAGKKTSIRESG